MDNNHKTIEEQVLEHIQQGEATMRPRWYFVLQAALFAVGTLLVMLTLFFLISFVTFALRVSGLWFMPTFGWRSAWPVLWSLPWLLIALVGVFVILLELLVRHYAFAYRRPLLYSAGAILVIAFGGGLVLAATPFHRTMFIRANDDQLPIVGVLYRRYADPQLPQVHRGHIEALAEDGFMLQDRHHDRVQVVITRETDFPRGMSIAEGDVVIVFGNELNNRIEALGIRRIEPEEWEQATGMMRGRPLPSMMP